MKQSVTYGVWKTEFPNRNFRGQYYFACENLPKEDEDILLVFVELDGSVWYGKVEFEPSNFSHWMWVHFEYPDWPIEE